MHGKAVRQREISFDRVEYVRTQNIAALGKITVGLIHDLSNAVHYTLQQSPPKMQKNKEDELLRMMRGVRQIAKLVDSARKQIDHTHEHTWFSLSEEIETAKELLREKAKYAEIRILYRKHPELKLFGSQTKFYQCIANLLLNAIEAYGYTKMKPTHKTIVIQARETKRDIKVFIRDNAGGIPESHYEKIFMPFYTTKSLAKNMGVGLAFVKEIMEGTFGGNIRCTSYKENTTFILTFPFSPLPRSLSS